MNYLTDINIQFVLETSTVNKISTLAFKILILILQEVVNKYFS